MCARPQSDVCALSLPPQICYTSFCDTLRLLGCFQAEAQLQQPGEEVLSLPAITSKAGEGVIGSNALADDIDLNTFHTIFTTPILEYVYVLFSFFTPVC